MQTDPIIRSATPDDLPALLDLYRDLHPDDVPAEIGRAGEILSALTAIDGSAVLLAEADGTLAASCTLIVVPNLTRRGAPFGLIENVVTARDLRQRGYGAAVLRAAISAGWQAGCYKVMLLTGSRDPATLRFYRAAGFDDTKTGFQIRRPG